ncbi:MAG TPA: arsenate reductase ArsC [Candidatus Dormibacteraeota bacterium]|jgi:arsenate reductase
MARVLFVCKQNAGRSQMSEALFQRIALGRHESRSAGTRPATHVHPVVVDVMRELDIDISRHRPQRLTDDLARWADVVVTMGCGDECPYIPGKTYIDWDLPDPAGRSLETVRSIRDDIGRRVDDLARRLDQVSPIPSS